MPVGPPGGLGLWALRGYRSFAERLATPELLPLARRAIRTASAKRLRDLDRYRGSDASEETYPSDDDCDDDRCN